MVSGLWLEGREEALVTTVMPLAALLYKTQLGPAFGYIAGPPLAVPICTYKPRLT
jgi:hypothetical protein